MDKQDKQVAALERRVSALERDLGQLLFTLLNCTDLGLVERAIREEDWRSQHDYTTPA